MSYKPGVGSTTGVLTVTSEIICGSFDEILSRYSTNVIERQKYLFEIINYVTFNSIFGFPCDYNI